MYSEEVKANMDKLRANAEAFFAQAGQKHIEVYRIENFTPVEIPEDHHGSFYDGDSYVIVVKGMKSYDIHYWEGVDSTADETGSAAALSVELSENLKMPSRHHMELMHEESDLFAGLWRQGLIYLHGGVDSGFTHVEPETIETTLYQVKGRRYPRVFPVPLSGDSMCHNDVFVLDKGMNIYFWAGDNANEQEKVSALNFAIGIKNDARKGKATLHYPRDMGGETEEDFWAALGGRTEVKAGSADEEVKEETNDRLKYNFYKVSDATGEMKVTEIEERPLKQSMLDTHDSFILEMYDKVYVWQGKLATLDEKKYGMAIANKHKISQNKPKGTSISRIPEGVEDAIFKSFFEGFYENAKCDYGMDKDGIDMTTTASQDISKITNQHAKAASLIKQSLGNLKSFRTYMLTVDDLKTPVEIGEDEKGIFFSENVYVVDIQGSEHRYMVCW